MAIRCRWPPENMCGYRAIVLGPQADLGQHRARPLGLFRGGEIGADRERRLEDCADLLARVERAVRILEHHLDRSCAGARARSARRGPRRLRRASSAPAVGFSIRATMRASVDLPQPDSPTTASVRPGFDRERHAADRMQAGGLAHQAARDGIHLLQVARLGDQWTRGAAGARRSCGSIGAAASRDSSRLGRPCGAHAAGLASWRSRARAASRSGSPSGKWQRTTPPAHGRSSGRSRHRWPVSYAAARSEEAALRADRRGPAPCPEWSRGDARRCCARASPRAARPCRGAAARRTARRRRAPRRPGPRTSRRRDGPFRTTTPMLCVTSTSAMPRSRCSPRSRSRICAWIGDVERGRRLVGDQQPRVAGDRHRDHHALVHAARQLVRKILEPARRRRNADLLQQLRRARVSAALRSSPRCSRSVSVSWKPIVKHGLRLVGRVLEDHRDVLADDLAAFAVGEARQVAPGKAEPLAR